VENLCEREKLNKKTASDQQDLNPGAVVYWASLLLLSHQITGRHCEISAIYSCNPVCYHNYFAMSPGLPVGLRLLETRGPTRSRQQGAGSVSHAPGSRDRQIASKTSVLSDRWTVLSGIRY